MYVCSYLRFYFSLSCTLHNLSPLSGISGFRLVGVGGTDHGQKLLSRMAYIWI
uniref:Uncharacterized protein n=1 Tax=Arundo donax TaxID=35708 RepID=A0A0A9HQX0_ARUDO